MSPFSRCDHLAVLGVERGGMLARLGRFWTLCKHGVFQIRDIHENLIPLKPNLAQATIHAAMMEQSDRGDPVRITILKSRKHGASTWLQAWNNYQCAYYPLQRAVTIAHTGESTDEIFGIARLIAKNHTDRKAEVLYRSIRWDDDSSYYSITAGGAAVGAGGTPSSVHLSEGPKWEKNKRETFYNVLNALPMTPTSCAALEFTAKGRDLFFEHWDKAHSPDSGYVPVFLAWYLDDRCVAHVIDPFLRQPDEIEIVGLAERDGITITDAMLQWRRLKILEIGPDMFRQEYPSTPEEAVMGSEGLILPGLRSCLFDELPFDPEMLPRGHRVGGIDFGYSDATVIWSGFWVSGQLWLTTYYRRIEGLASDHIVGIEPQTRYSCDPANLTDRKELARAVGIAKIPGVILAAAPRKRRPGEDIVTNELRILASMIRGGRLHIARQIADQVILEADSYSWNERTGKPKDTRGDAVGHYDSIDALRYCVLGVDAPKQSARQIPIGKPTHGRMRFADI